MDVDITKQCDELNHLFAIPGVAHFSCGRGGMAQLDITTPQAHATIALQGAHLTAWQSAGEQPVIWLSEQAIFAPGRSLRGGVPICWPWFGAHSSDTNLPAHGFARTATWQVTFIEERAAAVSVGFSLLWSDQQRAMWPQPTALDYCLTIGEQLTLQLTTRNLGDEPITIGQALHTYFGVGAIETVTIDGLDGCDYLDKVEGFRRQHQHGAVRFAAEVDRIYLGSTAECLINDPDLKRRIHIRKQGSGSTVVWNPWAELACRMGDLGPEGYRKMVCVESANAAEDVVVIAAGDSHSLQVEYGVEPMPLS